ncbi:hypothetical protein Hanom_Chr04g00287161 [Helianthus anomalus]
MAKLGPVSRVLSNAFVQARDSLRRITPHVMKVMPFSALNHVLAHFCVSSCTKYESDNHGSTPYHHQHKD